MANIEWGKLGFAYMKTNTIVKMYYQNGQWGPVISSADDNITINSYAASLHYGVECFEGLKAFRGKNGEIRIFRPDENAKSLLMLYCRSRFSYWKVPPLVSMVPVGVAMRT